MPHMTWCVLETERLERAIRILALTRVPEAPPSAGVTLALARAVVIAVIALDGPIVAVQHHTNHFGRVQQVDGFLDQSPWCLVGADNQQEAVHAPADEAAIRQTDHGRRIGSSPLRTTSVIP